MKKIFENFGLEQLDILDVLLDENNRENIILVDDKGTRVECEQLAVIPMLPDLYCILHPVATIEGLGETEAIVFRVVGDDGNYALKVEEDDLIASTVFEKYMNLLEDTSGCDN